MNRNEALEKLKRFKAHNASRYGIERIGLFGSVARNEATQSSDIDVCIQTKTPDMFMLVHLRDELMDVFDTPVDLVRLRDSMNPYLQKRINQEAIYV